MKKSEAWPWCNFISFIDNIRILLSSFTSEHNNDKYKHTSKDCSVHIYEFKTVQSFFAICKHSSKTWFKWKLPVLYINITIKLNRSTVHLGVQLKKGVHRTSAIEMTQRKEKDYLVPHVTVYSSFHSSLSVEEQSMLISLRDLPNTFSPHNWNQFVLFF